MPNPLGEKMSTYYVIEDVSNYGSEIMYISPVEREAKEVLKNLELDTEKKLKSDKILDEKISKLQDEFDELEDKYWELEYEGQGEGEEVWLRLKVLAKQMDKLRDKKFFEVEDDLPNYILSVKEFDN